MADEKQETTAAETAQAPKKKINWKAKRLPIVIAAVVVVTVLGVAGWAWRSTPEFCDQLCHNTMGKYYNSYMNDTESLAYEPWPSWDESLLKLDEVEILVQVLGKPKARLMMPVDATQEVAEKIAFASPEVQSAINGRTVRKVIFVPKRLLNIVVG